MYKYSEKEKRIIKRLGHKKCQLEGCLEYFKPLSPTHKFCGNRFQKGSCSYKHMILKSNEHRLKHLEYYRKFHKEYYRTEKGKEVIKKSVDKYRFNNKEKVFAYNQKWKKINRKKHNLYVLNAYYKKKKLKELNSVS